MCTFGCYDQYAKHPKKLMATQLPHYGDDLIMQRINLGLFLTILFALVAVPFVSPEYDMGGVPVQWADPELSLLIHTDDFIGKPAPIRGEGPRAQGLPASIVFRGERGLLLGQGDRRKRDQGKEDR